MSYFSIISAMKSRKFLEKMRMGFGEIDLQYHRFWLFAESLKEYMQNIS